MSVRLLSESVALLREVAETHPITYSQEGLDDGCLFCGAYKESVWEPEYETYAVHKPTCVWVVTRLWLGMDLGIHQVESQEPERAELPTAPDSREGG